MLFPPTSETMGGKKKKIEKRLGRRRTKGYHQIIQEQPWSYASVWWQGGREGERESEGVRERERGGRRDEERGREKSVYCDLPFIIGLRCEMVASQTFLKGNLWLCWGRCIANDRSPLRPGSRMEPRVRGEHTNMFIYTEACLHNSNGIEH